MTAIVRFEPYADHLLFVLTDAEAADGVFDGETWKKSEDEWRLAVEPHALVICTARFDVVPVTLAICDAPPPTADIAAAEHVVEADLDLPSGRLAVTGGTQLPDEVQPIVVDPGRYRVRVHYMPTDYRPRGSDNSPGELLDYRIAIWPSPAPHAVDVLKQGALIWAY